MDEKSVDFDSALAQLHLDLRDDASPTRLAYVSGAIGILEIAGVLSHIRAECWRAMIQTCPGHRNDPRSWCAYCGNCSEHLS